MLTDPRSPEVMPQLIELHHSFAATEYGQILNENVRFDRYKPVDVSNERWVALLGSDVNNLVHMPLTLGLTRDMVSRLNEHGERLTPHQVVTLCLAAIIHDWGEAITGDLTFDQVTAGGKVEEEQALDEIISSLEQVGDVDLRTSLHAAREVAFDASTPLGHIFNTVERIGYLRTGLRAMEHVVQGDAPDCGDGLLWLTENVIGNSLAVLVERAEQYPPVADYLMHMQEPINQALSVIAHSPWVFNNYNLEDQGTRAQMFQTARTTYSGWLGK